MNPLCNGYLHDWCQFSDRFDIATGNFEIGSLLGLDGEWQKVDKLRILMGGDVSFRTNQSFRRALEDIRNRLDDSIEAEKEENDFLLGVAGIVAALKAGQIECRVYRKERFHAKAYITHGREKVIGSYALVGSSNFTWPSLKQNVELNVQITGTSVVELQEWYEAYWDESEDVTAEILAVIERQIQEFEPFDIWARSLHELFGDAAITTHEWERLGRNDGGSEVFPILDHYQQEGYWNLLKIANAYGGAFLCDGVGLGKTFIGMMLLERLVIHDRQRVVLIVPKAARKDVWESTLKIYCPKLMDGFMPFRIINHTDLTRKDSGDVNWPLVMANIRDQADVVVIDEAHLFRNRGSKNEDDDEKDPSRYWRLFDMLGGAQGAKKLFLLTATPINNRLSDFCHMLELFTREDNAHFSRTLGINSVPGHFNVLEKSLKKLQGSEDAVETNLAEAEEVLDKDTLFEALVVQRSRAYVIESQKQQGVDAASFPSKQDPQVAEYSIRKTYGRLLEQFEKAFSHKTPLFALSIYYPLVHYKGDTEKLTDYAFTNARQKQVIGLIRTQFLKRFESSVVAFETSCERLLHKLLTWAKAHAIEHHEQRKFAKWEARNEDILGVVSHHQHDMWDSEPDAELLEDLITPEMLEAVELLEPSDYYVDRILDDVLQDLNQLADFLKELAKFKPRNDDKLQALIGLLKKDKVLKKHKCLIFTEFADTARYLKRELINASIEGVESVDGSTGDRGDIIHRFAPYYNLTSSAELIDRNKKEIRILISTDVLSEGLNLQDATRLINYDIHWNPVRLMQRIGRVDRRMNPAVEKRLIAAHPEQEKLRGEIAYWNFLPPDELNHILSLYTTVTNKTLKISKVFGIEGKKLLTPEDDFDALKDLNALYEGDIAPLERLRLEYRDLIKDDPELEQRLEVQPLRVFSGRGNIEPGTRAVFFCYGLPARDENAADQTDEVPWTFEAEAV